MACKKGKGRNKTDKIQCIKDQHNEWHLKPGENSLKLLEISFKVTSNQELSSYVQEILKDGAISHAIEFISFPLKRKKSLKNSSPTTKAFP